jgi:hypothetical protein
MASIARRTALIAVAFVLCLVPEFVPSQVTGVLGTTISRGADDFPVGWYDQLYNHATFASMQAEGTNDVLPYGVGSGVPTYLTSAANAGSGVFVQIDPALVRAGDVDGITSFVSTYKDYTAVRGWYLADEPTLSGEMTPATGAVLYDAIKAADPVHPVAIAFYLTEDAAPFANAMDVMMWDYYPAATGSPEFANLDVWHSSLRAASVAWRTGKGFIPIVQAFGSDGTRYTAYRLPTAREERFMVFDALTTGVDGLFFWAHYASDPTWRSNVFVPLMSDVNGLLPAVVAGPLIGATSSKSGVDVALFRDPGTKHFVLLAVRNGPTKLRAKLHLPAFVPSSWHTARKTFAPYEVKVFRF